MSSFSLVERDGESKNISYRPKRLKKFMQTRLELKQKKLQKIQLLPFIHHFSRKRYPFHLPSISDKWCPFHIPCLELCIPFDCCKSMHCFLFLFFFFFTQKSISKIACTPTLFYFSFRSYPLALAVNKSPAVYILSPALDGL